MSNLAFIYNTGDDIHGQKQFQQLVTMDVPDGVLSDAKVTYKGLVLKYTEKLYFLPLPGEGGNNELYKRARKLEYKWKSKKFVFPGRITLAAGKIVHDCGSPVTFNLYVNCRLVWTAEICDCNPFRIPTQITGNEVEIEVIGKSPIQKIKIASSIRELMENE
jgi:hypothetical protein